MALRRALAVVTKCALAVELMSLCKHVVLARCVMFSKEQKLYVEPRVGDTWNVLWDIRVVMSSGVVL